jgi:putative hydrolase of the HAD superfamily
MDGTLLDLNFDNHFWTEHVPMRYAAKHALTPEEAKRRLVSRFQAMEGTLQWYCLDYWSEQLGMDVALLKREVEHLIAVHPYVTTFLDRVRSSGRRAVLVTNAHVKSLALKMERTPLGGHLDKIISSHDFGAPKETQQFWERMQAQEPFDPATSLLIDDSLPVLRAARLYGVSQVVAVANPDSTRPARQISEFPAIHSFAEIMPE